MKYIVGGIIGLFLCGFGFNVVRAAGELKHKKIWERESGTDTVVIRVVDNELGVICYVIPNEHCQGDCAYTPAISCLHK